MRLKRRWRAPFALRFEDVERDADPRWGRLCVVHLDRAQLACGADGDGEIARAKPIVLRKLAVNPGGVQGLDTLCNLIKGDIPRDVTRATFRILKSAGLVCERQVKGEKGGRPVLLFRTQDAPRRRHEEGSRGVLAVAGAGSRGRFSRA
jgi:hypothetical protein